MAISCRSYTQYPYPFRTIKNLDSTHGCMSILGFDKSVKVGQVLKQTSSPEVHKSNGFMSSLKDYFRNYKKNIKHTFEHKVYFSIIEKELFGKCSVDSITHDLDKMLLYILGMPKSFVTRFHKKHSTHHCESGKKMNLRSMLCDNIASIPAFKPEKKRALRDYFQNSPALQKISGFKELLEKYNYGENLDINKIKRMKFAKDVKVRNLVRVLACMFSLF